MSSTKTRLKLQGEDVKTFKQAVRSNSFNLLIQASSGHLRTVCLLNQYTQMCHLLMLPSSWLFLPTFLQTCF